MIKKYSLIKGSYGFMSQSEIDHVKKWLKIKNVSKIEDKKIELIRVAYTKEKIMIRHNLLKRSVKELFKLFKSGDSIKKLSVSYDFAPTAIVRQILTMYGLGKQQIKDSLLDPSLLMDPKYNNRFAKISKDIMEINNEKLDVFASANQDESRDRAEQFEIDLGKVLTNMNVPFKTQDELSVEQIKVHGRAINTPDFLMRSDLVINGHPIKWIDAKNFYGANTFMIKISIKKQTKKYLNKWGPGAIVFRHGFSEKLNISPDVMMIGYDDLPH